MTHGAEDPFTARLATLEDKLGYKFLDRSFLERAMTHRSFAHESENEGLAHNEALEFLGDSVLGFLVSSMVFRRFPDRSEGELSRAKAYLVSAANLVTLAKNIGLGEYVRLSRGEEKTGGRTKRAILVDACEALIGAVYLDGGIEAAGALVRQHMLIRMDLREGSHARYGDFKSALQERLHDMGRAEPVYSVVQEIGPDHSKVFVVQIAVSGEIVAEGRGQSKKAAQQEAARLALAALLETDGDPDADACGHPGRHR